MKMELSIGGQTVTWDSDQHPYWPPVDSNGQIIGDVPWKFFEPEARSIGERGIHGRG